MRANLSSKFSIRLAHSRLRVGITILRANVFAKFYFVDPFCSTSSILRKALSPLTLDWTNYHRGPNRRGY